MDVEGLGFIDPDDLPEPDVLAVGGWTCKCGLLTFSGVKGGGAGWSVSMRPTCPECGETAEILAAPSGHFGGTGTTDA